MLDVEGAAVGVMSNAVGETSLVSASSVSAISLLLLRLLALAGVSTRG